MSDGRVCVPWRRGGAGPYGEVFRPILPVTLRAPGTGKQVGTLALMDSGADFTHGATRLLDQLGVRLQDCEGEITAFNNTRTITYRTPIDLTIADTFTIRFDSMAFRDWGALTPNPNTSILLGTNDILRFLKVTLDFGEGITFEPREPAADNAWSFPHDVLEAEWRSGRPDPSVRRCTSSETEVRSGPGLP